MLEQGAVGVAAGKIACHKSCSHGSILFCRPACFRPAAGRDLAVDSGTGGVRVPDLLRIIEAADSGTGGVRVPELLRLGGLLRELPV